MFRTSFTIKSVKNFSFLLIVQDVEVGVDAGDCKDEIEGRLLSKNSNGAIGYLSSNAKKAFI